MHFKSDSDLRDIATGIANLTLPKPDWTHAAHFAAAVWMIDNPDTDAFVEMPGIIRTYNEATGVKNTDSGGYHETITLASLKATEHALKNREAGSALFEVANDLMDGPFGKSSWLLEFWSKNLLFSVSARREWTEPDLKPLPF